MITLYVEGSLCMRTGAAGWGATLSTSQAYWAAGGFLDGDFQGAVVLMELCAVRQAVTHMRHRLAAGPPQLTLAMRSTAALAVLRWVFPEAPCSGAAEIQPPRRLKAAVRDAQCLYDLHDITERLAISVSLQHVQDSGLTRLALDFARQEMERARHTNRSPA